MKASINGHGQVVSLLINHSSFNSINEKSGWREGTALDYGKYLKKYI